LPGGPSICREENSKLCIKPYPDFKELETSPSKSTSCALILFMRVFRFDPIQYCGNMYPTTPMPRETRNMNIEKPNTIGITNKRTAIPQRIM
jgi:hypothetical protein